jgi:hypothetical protein
MARFTTAGGSGDGTPGAPGADGADGKDSLFLGTWNSVTEFLAIYQGGPVGLADGDWWAFVKDNTDQNKVYVVREDPNSATGWVIDDNESFILPQGEAGADGADGENGTDALWDYLGEYNGGVIYGAGAVVTYDGQLWYRNVYTSAGYAPGVGNTYWDLLAAKGADGTDGAQGDPGSPGLVYLGSYVSGNGYIANIAVVKGSDNNLYIATSSGGLGDPVGNSAEWSIFLPKGVDGEDAVLPQDLGTTDSPTFSKITLTSNGAIDNITIGDDVLIGDGNIANHLVIVGNQDSTQGGIVLGDNKTEQVSSYGSNLSLDANNDIILNPGSTYAYIGTPTIGGETRIATWDYVTTSIGTGSNGEVTRWSPTFTATGLTFTGSGATYPTYNSNYVKNGRMVSFNIEVNLSTVTNFGTGQYKLQLPFTPQFGFNHFSGWIWADPNVDPDTGTGHTILNADTAGITDVLDLHYLKQSGGANSPIREGLFLQGTPVTLSTISKIYVNGTYITSS